MRRADPLIIGGGPAGAAAAIALARGGTRALVIERNRETGDALCGGFLSWRSLATLEQLGLSPDALGGHAIDRVRLFAEGNMGEAPLPGRAIGVSRHRLDGTLLAMAEHSGAQIERGVAVRHAEPSRVETVDGAEIACDTLFLATGKHDCRGLQRPRAGNGDPVLGLRYRIAPSPHLARLIGSAIELHLFRGGYAGLLLQEDGSANLCIAVHKSRIGESGGSPRALLETIAAESPQLGERIAFGRDDAAIDAIGAVPYGWRATLGTGGLYRLGDQAAVIASLAGEGMGIALASGVMAATHWLAGGAPAAPVFQAALARRTRFPVALAGWLANLEDSALGRWAAPRILGCFPGLAAAVARLTRITPDAIDPRRD